MATVKRRDWSSCRVVDWSSGRVGAAFSREKKEKRFSIETVSHCYVALDQEYINKEDMDQVNKQADVVWKKVNNFIKYLNKHV